MNELKKILLVTDDEKQARITYSKETLKILSKNAPCQVIPPCLCAEFFGDDGFWDPEIWHQSFSPSSYSKSEKLSHVADDVDVHSGLVLGPQRRSFQGGCHVRTSSNSLKSYPSTSKSSETSTTKYIRQHSHQDNGSHRTNGIYEEKTDWNVEYKKRNELSSFEGPKKSKEFNRPYMLNKKHFADKHFPHSSNDEGEPEWISYGPSSKFDTIELQGFEESEDFSWMGKEIPMDDVPQRKKKADVTSKTDSEKESSSLPEVQLKSSDPSETSPDSQLHDEGGSSSQKGRPHKAGSELELLQENLDVPESLNEGGDMHEVKSRFSRWFDQPQNSVAESITSPASTTTVPQPSSSSVNTTSETDVHGTDAFNRLIASLRATDKVKEQMQQRNQQIQALQSIINVSKSRKATERLTLSSADCTDNDIGTKPISQSRSLKQQLEMQKNVYQLKKRQIEQQQNSSLHMYGHDEAVSFTRTGNDPKVQASDQATTKERALATASLAAKLAEKGRKNDFLNLKIKSSSNEIGGLVNSTTAFEPTAEDTAISFVSTSQPKSESSGIAWRGVQTKNTLHQHESALLIAQMLAKAGVTEEQLKQLTLDQQELIISMVQNQFSQRDILKLVKKDQNSEYAEGHAHHLTVNQQLSTSGSPVAIPASGTKDNFSTPDMSSLSGSGVHSVRKLPTTLANVLLQPKESSSASFSQQTLGASRPPQSRVFNHTVLPVHPTLISPVVPHLVPSNITHPLISPVAHSTLTHMVQPTPSAISHPHPALLMQMQHQMYASQVAQQQQHAVLAALHQQQLVNGQFTEKHHSGSETTRSDETFQNPLSQWFSREVLRQSQFSATTPVGDATRLYSSSNTHSNTGPVMQNKH